MLGVECFPYVSLACHPIQFSLEGAPHYGWVTIGLSKLLHSAFAKFWIYSYRLCSLTEEPLSVKLAHLLSGSEAFSCSPTSVYSSICYVFYAFFFDDCCRIARNHH